LGGKVTNQLGVFSQLTLATQNLTAHLIISAGTLVWILGILFIFILYPSLVKKYPLKAIQYQSYITWIVYYLSNFSILFLIPAFENTMRVFNCRYRSSAGAYVNTFDPLSLHCYEGSHWILIFGAFVLLLPFVYGTLRYTKAFKEFGQETDLHDKDWFIRLEAPIKVNTFIL
jgi:hypothetical protein